MQDTNGSGKEMYCAESADEMLCSYVNTCIYIYILKRLKARNPQNPEKTNLIEKNIVLNYFLVEQFAF